MTKPVRHAIAADVVFDGDDVRRDHAVVIERSRIASLVPRTDLAAAMPCEDLPAGTWLAPGFIDVQVNGGGDVLFNDEPTPEALHRIATAHRRFGTTGLLPTLITDTAEKMRRAADAVRIARAADPSILGIHFEGPFLSPEKPGVHPLDRIRAPDAGDEELLKSPLNGVTLVTLAPERVQPGFVARLVSQGVKVALGHSMATYDETRAAQAEGLSGFTHLFNAMRPLASRDPGPIAAALESEGAWIGLIVDGRHVDPAMLRLALRGTARPILVTDAMPPVGGSQPSFLLAGRKVAVENGVCVRDDGALAGAALDMATAVRNCLRLLGVELAVALRFASAEPARFLGLDRELGRLAAGYRADIVAFEPPDMRVVKTWVAGQD